MADFKKNKVTAKFLNPFDKGVTYDDFKKAIGNKSIADYCKGKLTKEQIQWLENDIKLIIKK